MSEKNLFQNAGYLQKKQYRTSKNLDARAALHRQFSTARVRWQPWLFGLLDLAPGSRVLECGCGPGWLWRENLAQLPAGCHITLTDLSPGMVAEAEAALSSSGQHFDFAPADIQALDFAAQTFDVVVANHMLYHVPSLPQALSEVKRVLKKNGRFVAATNGENHMKELADLFPEPLRQVTASLRLGGDGARLPFRLENGRALLEPFFQDVTLHLYEDSLEITEVEPLLAYAFSMISPDLEVPEAVVSRLHAYWADTISNEGRIKISKQSGVFLATK